MEQESNESPIIQTVAEPLQQLLKEAAGVVRKGAKPDKTKAETTASVRRFHPINRQPLAKLTIVDDGSDEGGEVIRIRERNLRIGRDKGHVKIPFDTDISSEHAELRCHKQKSRYRWYLIDLGSTNGTFLRAYRASLSSGTELILGGRRYTFHLPETQPGFEETQALQTQAYRAPSRTMHEQLLPRLTETGTARNETRSFPIGGTEAVFGSEKVSLHVPDDPFLSPEHARIFRDERDRWMIEDKRSLNGVWIRVKKMALDQKAEFQLGQQRFRFQPK